MEWLLCGIGIMICGPPIASLFIYMGVKSYMRAVHEEQFRQMVEVQAFLKTNPLIKELKDGE